jgi:hypothetical protein
LFKTQKLTVACLIFGGKINTMKNTKEVCFISKNKMKASSRKMYFLVHVGAGYPS